MPIPAPTPSPAAGAAPGAPKLPGTMAGTPLSTGSGPALSPGGGEGNLVAAKAQIASTTKVFHKALMALPVGGKEYKGVVEILKIISRDFGSDEQESLVPAALRQLGAAQAGPKPTPPMPLAAAAPPAGAGGSPPPMPAAA